MTPIRQGLKKKLKQEIPAINAGFPRIKHEASKGCMYTMGRFVKS